MGRLAHSPNPSTFWGRQSTAGRMRGMNPLILRTRLQLETALRTETEVGPNRWAPRPPLHTMLDRVRACVGVLRGRAYVLEFEGYQRTSRVPRSYPRATAAN